MANKQQIEKMKFLVDRYLEIVNSDKNKKNMDLWQNHYNWNRDRWRGIPAAGIGITPYTVCLGHSLWSKILNTSLVDYGNDPYTHMEMQLRMKIYQYENIKDNTPFTDELYIWFGPSTELAIFGCEQIIYENKEPWIKSSIVTEDEDINSLAPLDFYKSGIMPKIHRFYEEMVELADGRLKVMFPNFARGPFSIATHLRGMEDMLVDMKLNPEFVHELMRYVVDSDKGWTLERNKFLGEQKAKCHLFNDEVDSPSISPASYAEFILPYEKELEKHFGGVRYWHSCGNTTQFIQSISELENIELFHVGPWTSYKVADEIFKDKSTLDICLHPLKDVMEASEEHMEEKLLDIKKSCINKNFTVRADTFMPHGDIDFQISQINKWSELAAKHLNGF